MVEARYPFERQSSTGASPIRLQFGVVRARPLLDQPRCHSRQPAVDDLARRDRDVGFMLPYTA
jgi:hypothetical protein